MLGKVRVFDCRTGGAFDRAVSRFWKSVPNIQKAQQETAEMRIHASRAQLRPAARYNEGREKLWRARAAFQRAIGGE